MAANRSLYILDWVRTLLATDTSINVVKVWKGDFQDRIIAYPFILNQTFVDTYEDGHNVTKGTAQVNILLHDKTKADPSAAGLNTDAYGDLVQKVEKLFDDAVLPVSEVHTGNLYRTRIYSARILSWDGQFDIGDTKVNIGCLVEINFTHTRQ